MAFRFNFTGRKRIPEAEAQIHVIKEDVTHLKVVLEQTFTSSGRNIYDGNDIVMLEAIRRTKLRRCSLGTVGELQKDTIADFPDFPNGKEVYYRLRIVDPVTHKLKGLAKTLKDADREQKPTDVESLLPVALSQSEDELGNLFWKVKFESEEPILIITSKKFNSYEPVKSPEFRALVLPEVLREVLIYTFIHSAASGHFPEWEEKWKKFVNVNLGVGGGPEKEPEALDENYIQETMQWINDAVRSFADKYQLSTISIKNLTTTEEGNE